ncbi:MAG: 5-formyltetrahydrofolate cyclo-ligase [Lentisphaeria bacterium]|nr:5-formyltetrahydrofolate cyclo-ligase [Lentisphaeria bacterium]
MFLQRYDHTETAGIYAFLALKEAAVVEMEQYSKQGLRREKRLLRKSLSAEDRKSFDDAICRTLEGLPEVEKFPLIAAYATDGTEPDLMRFLEKAVRKGRKICLPRWISDSEYGMAFVDESFRLVQGKWNIPEPGSEAPSVPEEVLKEALFLVPGVAFDEGCARLGRGKGIYDRMLDTLKGKSIGIFYECQKCGKVPLEEHDRLLDLVVTEKQVYRNCNGTGKCTGEK